MTVRSYIDRAYPPSKRHGEKWYPGFYPVRAVALALTPVLIAARVTPNRATYLSLISIVAATTLNVFGEFEWAAAALFAALVFDASDGQIARITGNGSTWGVTLERIQADLGYLLIVPSLAVGLELKGIVDPELAYLAFLGLGTFVLFRRFLSRQVRPVSETDPLAERIMLSQLKPHDDARAITPIGAIIYHAQRNMVNQLGLLYPSVMLISVWKQAWLQHLVLGSSIVYLAAAGSTILATLAFGNRYQADA